MNENTLRELSIQAVKEACEKYWIDKDASCFKKRLYNENAPVVGLDCADEDGFYIIDSAEYKGSVQTDKACIVTAELTVHDTEKIFRFSEGVSIMVGCMLENDEIHFLAVHMAVNKKRVNSMDVVKGPSFYYKKLMGSLCDLLIEARLGENTVLFDEDAYYNLFHERRKFVSIDQLFWYMCENYVVEQDWEKMDLFRESDMEKRLKNEDLVIETCFRIKRDADEVVWIKMMVVFILDVTSSSVGTIFFMMKDCTQEMTEKMKNLEFARMDFLTQIWNRRYTEELIEKRIAENKKGIFILYDIDKFKKINDSYGHLTGDDMLVKISESVKEHLRDGDVFGRLGGDEFVLWLSGSGNEEADKVRVWEIVESTKFRHSEKGIEMDIHCSVGVVFFDGEATCFDDLYAKADAAMYQAKGAGRNTIVIA